MAVQCAYTLPDEGRRCRKKVKDGEYCHLHVAYAPKAPKKGKNEGKKPEPPLEAVTKSAPERRKKKKTEKKPEKTFPDVDTCPVCLEDAIEVVRYSCGHGVCAECRGKLRQALCPLCRKDVSKELSSKEKAVVAKYRRADEVDRQAQHERAAREAQEQIRRMEEAILRQIARRRNHRRQGGGQARLNGLALHEILRAVF